MKQIDLLAKAFLLREADERSFYEVLASFKAHNNKLTTNSAYTVGRICSQYCWDVVPTAATKKHMEKIFEAYRIFEEKSKEYGLRLI